MIKNLTVVRFPDGTWSWGGKPDSPTYDGCEVFIVETAQDEKSAVRKAQYKRQKIKRAGELI